jgi:hypothetical protein
MPICETCLVAITKLSPQEKAPPSNERDVDTTLPRFGNWIFRSCWICSKFSKWLEFNHPELFNSWHKMKLPVIYALIGFLHASRPQVPLLCVIILHVTVQGLDRDDDACGFEINLIPGEGILIQIYSVVHNRETNNVQILSHVHSLYRNVDSILHCRSGGLKAAEVTMSNVRKTTINGIQHVCCILVVGIRK